MCLAFCHICFFYTWDALKVKERLKDNIKLKSLHSNSSVLGIQWHVKPRLCLCVPYINNFIFPGTKKTNKKTQHSFNFCYSTVNARPWNLTSIWHAQIAHSVSCQRNDLCKSISQVWGDTLCGLHPNGYLLSSTLLVHFNWITKPQHNSRGTQIHFAHTIEWRSLSFWKLIWLLAVGERPRFSHHCLDSDISSLPFDFFSHFVQYLLYIYILL